MKKLKYRVVAKPQQKGKEMDKLYIVCKSEKEESKVLEELEKQGKVWLMSKGKPTEKSFFKNEYREFAIVVYENGDIAWTVDVTSNICRSKSGKKISAAEFLKKNKETIVIYRNGAETIALEKNTGRKAVAKCHADDTYSFEIGAKLALERLLENYKPEEKPQEYYNGKVVCIQVGEQTPINILTKGKIYEFVDGIMTFDDGDKTVIKRRSLEEINENFSSKFIELVE